MDAVGVVVCCVLPGRALPDRAAVVMVGAAGQRIRTAGGNTVVLRRAAAHLAQLGVGFVAYTPWVTRFWQTHRPAVRIPPRGGRG